MGYNKEYHKKYREAHKAERKAYLLANQEKIKQQNAERRKAKIEEYSAKMSLYYSTPRGKACHLAHAYKQSDRRKGFDISKNIDAEWIEKNIFAGQKCYYCGESDWKKLGVDRINNDMGHIPGNCLPCCQKCNTERKDKISSVIFRAIKQNK